MRRLSLMIVAAPFLVVLTIGMVIQVVFQRIRK
jgi:hypothetical protein